MTEPLHVLLADDDDDDRFFFELALKDVPFRTELTVVEDGEKLMKLLSGQENYLPDVLFLDLNMPRKNGTECLKEIRNNKKLKNLPVVIHSTSMHESVADLLYRNGADFYSRKTDSVELTRMLHHVLSLIADKKFERPSKDKFILAFNHILSKK